MAFSTRIRTAINKALAPLNIQLATLTAARTETARLDDLAAAGLFDRPVYSLSPGMEGFDPTPLSEAYGRLRADIERLKDPAQNSVGYRHGNSYFSTPDTEILYLMVRTLEPRRVVEIGCGNSTRITRQAIRDGELKTELVAIDPWPRTEIGPYVDRFEKTRLEHLQSYAVFEEMQAGDFLFIDSSHEVRLGNDVARIFCDVIPRLKPGVVVHFHDIFLPFEYPLQHAHQHYSGWGEQYMLHALLQGRAADILWPGYYVQRARPDLAAGLPFLAEGRAQSFWLRLS